MISSIKRRILDKSSLLKFDEGPMEDTLSHFPWSLGHSFADENDQDVHGRGRRCFLEESFIDLRYRQNVEWAEERLVEGVAFARNIDTLSQAETSYQEGLKIDPLNANLLTAYGALLANQGNTEKALEMLDKALHIEPDHGNAKSYKEAILDRINNKVASSGRIAKEKDSLFAESVAGESTDEDDPDTINVTTTQKMFVAEPPPLVLKTSKKKDTGVKEYHLLPDNLDYGDVSDNETKSDRGSRRRKHKHSRKKEKKKRKKKKH